MPSTFQLKPLYPDTVGCKQPVVRLKPSYYQTLALLKTKTGLPLGNIVEQCIDFALSNMEEK